MSTILLEFEELEILRPKKRWKLYFVIIAEHPEDSDKMVLSYLPQLEPYFVLKPRADNKVFFEPENSVGADGLFVIEREMPADRNIKVQVYLRHSRQATRNAGNFLKEIESELGDNAMGTITDILGTTSSWLVFAKAALPIVGSALKKVKDRDFGMLSMDERFGDEFENQEELDRQNTFSSGDARLVWSWSIK